MHAATKGAVDSVASHAASAQRAGPHGGRVGAVRGRGARAGAAVLAHLWAHPAELDVYARRCRGPL